MKGKPYSCQVSNRRIKRIIGFLEKDVETKRIQIQHESSWHIRYSFVKQRNAAINPIKVIAQ